MGRKRTNLVELHSFQKPCSRLEGNARKVLGDKLVDSQGEGDDLTVFGDKVEIYNNVISCKEAKYTDEEILNVVPPLGMLFPKGSLAANLGNTIVDTGVIPSSDDGVNEPDDVSQHCSSDPLYVQVNRQTEISDEISEFGEDVAKKDPPWLPDMDDNEEESSLHSAEKSGAISAGENGSREPDTDFEEIRHHSEGEIKKKINSVIIAKTYNLRSSSKKANRPGGQARTLFKKYK